MTRIYRGKGDKALRAKLTVPITEHTMAVLERTAKAAGVGKTDYVRTMLLEALAGVAT